MKINRDLKRWLILAKTDVEQAAAEFSQRPANEATELAERVGSALFIDMASRMGSDTAALLLRNLPQAFKERVIAGLVPEKRAFLREILSYAPGTAGALMSKEFLAIPIHFSIHEATEYLRALPAHQKGKVSYIYVVDANQRLEGVIQVRDLLFYSPKKPVREILVSPVVQVEAGMTQMDVAKLLQRHRYLGLPVVDRSQRLVGIISADLAMQALQEEVNDDIAKIVGTSPEEMRTHSARRIVRLRLPWLFVNIVSGLICAYIAGVFQNDPAVVAGLFLFIPIVLGLSESAGVQGATIVVRNLAQQSLVSEEVRKVFFREVLAGIMIGAACGVLVGAAGYAWHANARLGIALAASMTLTVIGSALLGLTLPLVFKRFRVDPAMASGPFVLAACDILTLMIYFNLSSLVLNFR